MATRFCADRTQLEQGVADLAIRAGFPRFMWVRYVEAPIEQQRFELLIRDTNHSEASLRFGPHRSTWGLWPRLRLSCSTAAAVFRRLEMKKGSRRLTPRTLVPPLLSYLRQNTTSASSATDRLSSGVDLLDLGLLPPQLLMDRLDVIVSLFPQRDFFDHAGSLADQRVLLCFDDLECTVRPIDVRQLRGLRDGLAQ